MPRNLEEPEPETPKQVPERIDPDDLDDDPESHVVRRDHDHDDDLDMEELDADDLRYMEGPDA